MMPALKVRRQYLLPRVLDGVAKEHYIGQALGRLMLSCLRVNLILHLCDERPGNALHCHHLWGLAPRSRPAQVAAQEAAGHFAAGLRVLNLYYINT